MEIRRRGKTLEKSFVFIFVGLFLYSLSWFLCHSFIGPSTKYFFLFLKNPGAMFVTFGLFHLSLSVAFEKIPKHFLKIEKVLIVLGWLAIVLNLSTVHFREVEFDPYLEFFRPTTRNLKGFAFFGTFFLTFLIVSEFLVMVLVLLSQFKRKSSKHKKRILSMVVVILGIISVEFFSFMTLLGFISREWNLFLFVNGFNTLIIYILLSGFAKERIWISIGFKTLIFNLALFFITISLISAFLIQQIKENQLRDFEVEKGQIRNQLEMGIKNPGVRLADYVIEMESYQYRINKPQKPLWEEKGSIPGEWIGFSQFYLQPLSGENADKIYWLSKVLANNQEYLIAISYLDTRQTTHEMMLKLGSVLLLGILLLFTAYPFLHKKNIVAPLQNLLQGIRNSESGIFDSDLRIYSLDEIGDLTESFNRMNLEIKSHQEELERRIQERTKELNSKLADLSSAQSQLLDAERMSTLGKLASQIAHEINNPLAAISASLESLTDFIFQEANKPEFKSLDFPQGKSFSSLDLPQNLDQTNLRKQKKNLGAILREAGMDNPESLADACIDLGIYSLPDSLALQLKSKEVQTYFQEYIKRKELELHAKIIQTAVKRASKIVFSLKHYSYSGTKDKKQIFPLWDGIESVLTIYSSILKNGIEVEKHISSNPQIYGYPEEMIQVWTNLISNSIQAFPKQKGKITIRIQSDSTTHRIQFEDNGTGIPEEVAEKVFLPFFTTKDIGVGTGLGMSIVKQIIENHHGTIGFESKPGRTVFTILLPAEEPKFSDSLS